MNCKVKKIIAKIISLPLGLFNLNYILTLLQELFKSKDVLINFNLKPNKIGEINKVENILYSSLSIIIQGKPVYENNFTLESIKLYQKIFPGCNLILSTWDNIDNYLVTELLKINVTVVKNVIPTNKGVSNINLQIKSTLSGLNCAKKLNSIYIIKTRTDQRIYASSILSYLINLSKAINKIESPNYYSRIIVSSKNTFSNRLYSISDMFQFGFIDDLIDFWTVSENDIRAFSNYVSQNTRTFKIPSYAVEVPEIILCALYLKKKNHVLKWTQNDFEEVLINYFIVIDKELIDIYWTKYKPIENPNEYYSENASLYEFKFVDWFNIFTFGLVSIDH
jgi:hypothetical protein